MSGRPRVSRRGIRRLTIAGLAVAALAVAVLAGLQPVASAASAPVARELGYVPGVLLVRFKPGLASPAVRSLLAARGEVVRRALPLVPGLREVSLPAGTSVPDGISVLQRNPDVLYAEPDWRRAYSAVSSDPLFPKQWSLQNSGQEVFQTRGSPGADIRATSAWGVQTGSRAVTVAVVDTGIALSHPDLAANIWTNPEEAGGVDNDASGFVEDVHGWNFIESNNNPSDAAGPDQGHGTAVAGIIGAVGNNGLGIAGINWQASLMALRAPLDVVGEIAAFTYARDHGARVINYSAGGFKSSASESAAITGAPKVLFVLAAANERVNIDGAPVYPCSYRAPNAVCVASTSQSDALSAFSDYGPVTVDVAAPGENILSTYPAGAISTDLSDDFSHRPLRDRWTRGGRGRKWRLTHTRHTSGVSDSARGAETNSWLRSRPLDLTERARCGVEFKAGLRMQPGGQLILEVSSHRKKHWRTLRRYGGRGNRTRSALLPKRFAGRTAVSIRFRLWARDGQARVTITKVRMTCITATDTYAFLTGTSFSAPEVAGAAALILAQNPGFNTSKLRAKLLSSVDQLPSLAGKVATGGRLDLAKAVSP